MTRRGEWESERRVLQALATLDRGGIERTVLAAAPELHSLGWSIEVLGFRAGGSLARVYEDAVDVVHVAKRGLMPEQTAFSTWRALRGRAPSIVHCHMGYVGGGVALGGHLLGSPVIVSVHSVEPTSGSMKWRMGARALLRRLYLARHRTLIERYAAAVVGHSAANLEAFFARTGRLRVPTYVVRNAVELPSTLAGRTEARAALGLGEHEIVVLVVANMRPEKNHEETLRIFCGLLQTELRGKLLLVGDGGERRRVEAMTEKLGLERVVRFEGSQNDLGKYYASADVLLSTSRSEGLGNALIEAQIAKCPVVATDIPAHREAVHEELHGWLFAPGDVARAVELLRSVIRYRGWLTSVLNGVALDQRGRFSAAQLAESLSRIYEQVGEKPVRR